tara:strand:+ start:680 stop:1792 length:1113 start_codon:yes stop_codon:yes gene_type:complete
MKKNITYLVILTLLATFFVACEDSKEDQVEQTFDRSLVLLNWSDNIITPSYEAFQEKLGKLKTSVDKFKSDVTQENLDLVRSEWLNAYKGWQHVEMFNIGKAEEIYYSSKMNVYPANISRIKSNIDSEQYNLGNANNNSAQGFPALDYLLYGGISDGSKVIDRFLSQDGSKYLSYLENCVNEMISLTKIVVDDWKANKGSFVSSTENTATSSINMLTNDFIFYYEKGFRANKLGIPAGIFSSNTIPENVEGYYNGKISKVLALEAMNAVHNFFVGKSFDNSKTKESFKYILKTLDAKKGDENLGEVIESKLLEAKSKIESLDDNFSSQINSDKVKFLETYDAIQKVVVLLKVDMLQALNINVDYTDADGD